MNLSALSIAATLTPAVTTDGIPDCRRPLSANSTCWARCCMPACRQLVVLLLLLGRDELVTSSGKARAF